MRKLFFLVLVFLCFSYELGKTNDVPRQETLIRRAFLDVTGLVPTVEEIDWYCVYNSNGYELAVNDLAGRSNKIWDVDPDTCKATLLSREYISQSPRLIDIRPSIVYIAGRFKGFHMVTKESVEHAKSIIISNALKECSSPGDVFDYISNQFMSRSTTMVEANILNRHFKAVEEAQGENIAYLSVLDHILMLPDVTHK